MSDSDKFYNNRKKLPLELNDKDRKYLIQTLIKSFENYEGTLFETNLKIRKLKAELKENINK